MTEMNARRLLVHRLRSGEGVAVLALKAAGMELAVKLSAESAREVAAHLLDLAGPPSPDLKLVD